MKHIYFARHGLSVLNKAGLMAGHTNTPLTDEGREQAKSAGHAAKDLGIDYIVSSPLSRAHETAEIIAKEIGYPVDKIHVSSLFIERNYGPYEQHPWSPDLNLDGFADVESRDEILERAKLAIEFLQTIDAKNILVVAHGSLGRALRHHIMTKFPWEHPSGLKNAEIVRWDFS